MLGWKRPLIIPVPLKVPPAGLAENETGEPFSQIPDRVVIVGIIG